MEEIWKDVVGYEGIYKINNLGIVKILNYRIKGREKILKLTIDENGYTHSTLNKLGIPKKYLTHRLVAQAFIPNPDNKPQVNHINGIKSDNLVENLEWCTRSENMLHAYKLGLKIITKNHHFLKNHPHKGKFGKEHHLSKAINQYSLEGEFIKEFGSIKEVERMLKLDHSSIIRCCKGRKKTAGGFMWKYK